MSGTPLYSALGAANAAGFLAGVPLGAGFEFVNGALKGNVFTVRVNNATNTLLESDLGFMIVKNDASAYTWTLPPDSSFPNYPTLAAIQGRCIALINGNAAGNVTISRGSGVALFNGTTNGNITLGPRQSIVIVHMPTANEWMVL